jgi:hypothetical protein
MSETIEHKGLIIKIEVDEVRECPITEWTTLGTFACFHRNYDLSNTDKFGTPEELRDYIESFDGVSLPLYLYDHSGITISTTPFSCPWDSGQVGFVFATMKEIVSTWKELSKEEAIEKAKMVLEAEVKTFDQYLTGDVWYYTIEDENENHLDSCGGFYGFDFCVEQAKDSVDYIIEIDNYQI